MPLSWNEIRSRALSFSREWEGETSERAEAQSFWNGFFEVFGLSRRRVAVFEKQVKLSRAGERLKKGRIDAFWKGVLLVEHKSKGQDLDKAFGQAAEYFEGLPERDLPRYILVSDFARFRLHDLESGTEVEFVLSDLHKKVRHFAFVAGYKTQDVRPQDPVNIRAAEQMGRLHDQLKASGYSGHALELLLVRLLFCLFADDTGIFNAQSLRAWLDENTREDGSDLGPQLALLFQTLDQPISERPKTLSEALGEFPFVNGKLFEEQLPMAAFNAEMRTSLLECCRLNWGAISPAIFGALFQSIMDERARRNLGAHYTSEENILKLIRPLFLDELWADFEKCRINRNRLFDFHKRLRTLAFFDPACGCGNFLVITYRELRNLELEVLRASLDLERRTGQKLVDVQSLIAVDVDQFFGIEIEEFPAQIAQVALWLIDHQMNMQVSEEFGAYFARIPLQRSPDIVHANALRMDWAQVVPPSRGAFVLGNPPFVGHQWRSDQQVHDHRTVWGEDGRYGRLDYVTCWYRKAADYMARNPVIRGAFVSTNSICQGEQVGTLWGYLLGRSVRIHFAHRSFQWSSEARGAAAVHCVIIGFGMGDVPRRRLFDYETPRAEPHETTAGNINPYLVDAPDVILPSRTQTPPGLPRLLKGSQPTDGGHLILDEDEKSDLLAREPDAIKWLRPYVGGDELINGGWRWCLWLKGIQPVQLRAMPLVVERVKAVAQSRLKSPTASVREFANRPTLFTQDRQPTSEYLGVPEVSSENRRFVPIAFLSADVIASSKVQIVEGAGRYHFGVLTSTMHNAWMRAVCGRLESRYSYSPAVYNNFPWPNPSEKQRLQIEKAAQGVLDARAAFKGASLAELYDAVAMPPELARAHELLDRAVDGAYGRKVFQHEAERVSFLFSRYQERTSLFSRGTRKGASRKQG